MSVAEIERLRMFNIQFGATRRRTRQPKKKQRRKVCQKTTKKVQRLRPPGPRVVKRSTRQINTLV